MYIRHEIQTDSGPIVYYTIPLDDIGLWGNDD